MPWRAPLRAKFAWVRTRVWVRASARFQAPCPLRHHPRNHRLPIDPLMLERAANGSGEKSVQSVTEPRVQRAETIMQRVLQRRIEIHYVTNAWPRNHAE